MSSLVHSRAVGCCVGLFLTCCCAFSSVVVVRTHRTTSRVRLGFDSGLFVPVRLTCLSPPVRCAVFNRALTDAELLALHTNPNDYTFYESEPRLCPCFVLAVRRCLPNLTYPACCHYDLHAAGCVVPPVAYSGETAICDDGMSVSALSPE